MDAARSGLLVDEREESWWGPRCKFAVTEILGGALGIFQLVVSMVGYAAVFTASPVFNDETTLVTASFISAAIGSFLMAWRGQLNTCVNIDPVAISFFLQACGAIGELEPELREGHGLLLCTIFTGLLGVCFWCIGAARLGVVLKFIPFIVVSGLLGGFGLILLSQGFVVTLGEGPQAWIFAGGSLDGLACIGALAVCTAMLRLSKSPGYRTVVVLVCTIGSLLVAPDSWYLKFDTNSGGFLKPWQQQLFALQNLRPAALFNAGVATAFVPFCLLLLVDWGAHLPAMEKCITKTARATGPMSHDQELRTLGFVNLLGCLGSQPTAHAVVPSVQAQDMGCSGVWRFGIAPALLLLAGSGWWTVVRFVPTFVFGAMLANSGAGLVKEYLVKAYGRIAQNEWRFLFCTSVAIWLDPAVGLGLGFVMSLTLFTFEYTVVSGIKADAKLCDNPSATDRTPDERLLLQERADECHIFWLHGYLFFGTVATLVDEVRAAPAQTVLLNLAFVPAVDASGVHGLVDLGHELKQAGRHLVLCGCVRRLKEAFQNADNGDLEFCQDFERALAEAEDRLLATPSDWPSDAELAWTRLLGPVGNAVAERSEQQKLEPHEQLFKHGQLGGRLSLIIRGAVKVEYPPGPSALRTPSHRHLGPQDRFVFEEEHPCRECRPGSLLGALECARFCSGDQCGYIGNAFAGPAGALVLSVDSGSDLVPFLLASISGAAHAPGRRPCTSEVPMSPNKV